MPMTGEGCEKNNQSNACCIFRWVGITIFWVGSGQKSFRIVLGLVKVSNTMKQVDVQQMKCQLDLAEEMRNGVLSVDGGM